MLKERHIYDHARDVEDLELDEETCAGFGPRLSRRGMIVVADTSPLNYLIQIRTRSSPDGSDAVSRTHGFCGFTCSSTGVNPRMRMLDPNRL